MGDKLIKIFKYIKESGGERAQLRLILRTGLLPVFLKNVPDDDTKIKEVISAAKEILKVSNIPNSVYEG